MSALTPRDSDPLRDFVASTRGLTELIDGLDPEALDRGIQHQLGAFDALKSAISGGSLAQSSAVVDAIEEARRTLDAVSGRQREVREELDQLRSARTRTLRRFDRDETAQFVSRRV